MHVMSKTVIINREKSFISTLHVYVSKSSKKSLEFSKLAKIIETKGLKILKHCRIYYVRMFAPLKHVLSD